MEHTDNTTTKPRKVRFAPKAPPRRVAKPVIVKKEETENDDAAAKELLRRFNESSLTRRPKFEKKVAPSRIAFGYGAKSVNIKKYGASNSGSGDGGAGAHASGLGEVKEYKEPWDYYSDYPVTLPFRRPYSGDPELLDEEEFGEAAKNAPYDEDAINAAEELGLTEENQEPSMIFLQLPQKLPMIKRSASADGTNSNLKSRKGTGRMDKLCSLDDIPAGYMGKMLVYRSGAVKLKFGDTLYDVSPGSDCAFAQEVAAINTEQKHCCVVGELNKRAIVVPDINSILDDFHLAVESTTTILAKCPQPFLEPARVFESTKGKSTKYAPNMYSSKPITSILP